MHFCEIPSGVESERERNERDSEHSGERWRQTAVFWCCYFQPLAAALLPWSGPAYFCPGLVLLLFLAPERESERLWRVTERERVRQSEWAVQRWKACERADVVTCNASCVLLFIRLMRVEGQLKKSQRKTRGGLEKALWRGEASRLWGQVQVMLQTIYEVDSSITAEWRRRVSDAHSTASESGTTREDTFL